MTFLVFLVSLGAALRLTRLVISDSITQPLRTFFEIHANKLQRPVDVTLSPPQFRPTLASRVARFLMQLSECPWCIGFWISAATTYLAINLTNATGHHVLGLAHPSFVQWWTIYGGLTFATSWLVGFIYTIAFTLELYEPPGSPHRH